MTAPNPSTAPPRPATTEQWLLNIIGGVLSALGLTIMVTASSIFVLVLGASFFVAGITMVTGANIVSGLRR